MMSEFLKQDEIILNDPLQYSSDLHGVAHTRRVNFLAMAIMNMENIVGRDRKIILEIVKNHAKSLSNTLMKAIQIMLAVKMAYRKHWSSPVQKKKNTNN